MSVINQPIAEKLQLAAAKLPAQCMLPPEIQDLLRRSEQEMDEIVVALDSPEAEKRRQEPHYKLLVRLDDFLHHLMEEERYKEEAGKLHAEVHEAAFDFVTRIPNFDTSKERG